MKSITYINQGLVFILEVEEESSPFFEKACQHVYSDLASTANMGKLEELHNKIKISPLEYECAPCPVTLKNGGYSDLITKLSEESLYSSPGGSALTH